jgi:hypothetical protein
MRRSGGNTSALLSSIRESDAYLPPGPIHVYSERAGGAVRLYIVHIVHISHIVTNKHFCHRREVFEAMSLKFLAVPLWNIRFCYFRNNIHRVWQPPFTSSGKREIIVYFTYFTYCK